MKSMTLQHFVKSFVPVQKELIDMTATFGKFSKTSLVSCMKYLKARWKGKCSIHKSCETILFHCTCAWNEKKTQHFICTYKMIKSNTDMVKEYLLKSLNLIEILGNLEVQVFKSLKENKFDGKLRAVIHTKILFIWMVLLTSVTK